MSNEEKILELLAAVQAEIKDIRSGQDAMDARISSMDARISSMDARMSAMEAKLDDLTEAHGETRESVNTLLDRVEELTEAHEETREGVNTLLAWAEKASNTLSLPLPKIG